MNYTTNLNLKKPEDTDSADIADINDNMDTLDTTIHALRQVPAVTSSDNGKFLRVVEGVWTAVTMSNASGGDF